MDLKIIYENIKGWKIVENIYDNNVKCDCGKPIKFVDLIIGDFGQSLKCGCGKHFSIAFNDDKRNEVFIHHEYTYGYDKGFCITQKKYYCRYDSKSKSLIENTIRFEEETIYISKHESEEYNIYYIDSESNISKEISSDFFDKFDMVDFENMACNFSVVCNERGIKPNYGEILKNFVKYENSYEYIKLLEYIFTNYTVEMLIKSNLEHLIKFNLHTSLELLNKKIYINIQGKNPSEILGLHKKVISYISKNKCPVEEIKLIQEFNKERTYNDFKTLIMDKESKFNIENLNRIEMLLSLGYTSERLKTYCNYITKAEEISARDFLVYLIDLKRMSDALLLEFRPYQKNVKERHIRIQNLYNITKNDLDNMNLKALSDKTKLRQVGDKYIAIVPESVDDFKQEASNQRHCVLSYIPLAAQGVCKIIFIRYIEDINKSYITVELDKGNKVIQAKKYMNENLNDEDKVYLRSLAIANNWIYGKKK